MSPVSSSGSVSRLLVRALILWIAAAAVYATLRLTYGDRPAFINVRWASTVDTTTRQRLEGMYHLTRGELREGDTWSYWLTDASRDNIRTLVGDAAVDDTHQIDRGSFRPSRTAPRGAYLGPGPSWIATVLEVLALGLLALGAVPLGLAALCRAGVPSAPGTPLATALWIVESPAAACAVAGRRISERVEHVFPEGSAESVAVFRVVFGSACLVFFAITSMSTDLEHAGESGVPRVAVRVLESVPYAIDWIRPWILFWCALFIAGVFARTSFVMLTVGAVAWATAHTTGVSSHTIAAFLVAMICLVWSRWGDVWSVDAWRRGPAQAKRLNVNRRVYGYTLWIPGVVLGTTFAAAAVAKMRESGLGWITNGTVKYHFLSDSLQAPVDWGLRLARHDAVAILMSFSAVSVEALVIVGAFSTRYRFRAMAGAGALSLLIGFWLFQGLFWPSWWILLLSFLPWHLIRPRQQASAGLPAPPSAPSSLILAQQLVVLAVIVQQITVSAFRLEIAPLMSTYGMYSTTYESPAEYEFKSGMTYWVVAGFESGTSEACEVGESDAETVSHVLTGRVEVASARRLIQRCFGSSRSIRMLGVEGRRQTVDWTRLAFGSDVSVPITGPIAVPRDRGLFQ